MSRGQFPGGGLDRLPRLILDSVDQAMAAEDYSVAFRLLKTLERTLLRPGISLAQRTIFVGLLVDAHRRLLEEQGTWQPMPHLAQLAAEATSTRH